MSEQVDIRIPEVARWALRSLSTAGDMTGVRGVLEGICAVLDGGGAGELKGARAATIVAAAIAMATNETQCRMRDSADRLSRTAGIYGNGDAEMARDINRSRSEGDSRSWL